MARLDSVPSKRLNLAGKSSLAWSSLGFEIGGGIGSWPRWPYCEAKLSLSFSLSFPLRPTVDSVVRVDYLLRSSS